MESEVLLERQPPSPSVLLDPLYGLVEAASQACDAISIRSDEPSARLLGLWRQAAHHPLPNITGMPATPLTFSGTQAAVPQLAGFAGSGKRIAFFVSHEGLQELHPRLVDGAPFVMHVVADGDVPQPFEGSFQLVARTPREALDLSLVAHRAAEMALCPGVLVSEPGRPGRDDVPEAPTPEALRALLGLPADAVETPTDFQRSLFGASRRRIPEALPMWMRRRALQLQADVPRLVEQAAAAVARFTGRSYRLVDTLGTRDADVVLVAAGGVYTWLVRHLDALREKSGVRIGLLHPTLTHPFPGHLVARAVQGKRGVVLVTRRAEGSASHLLDELERSLERAMLNAHAPAGSPVEDRPYPGYPTFRQAEDRPPVFTCTQPEDAVGLAELAGIVAKVASRSADALHHELPGAEAWRPDAGDEAPRVYQRPAAPPVVRDEAVPEDAPEADAAVLRALLSFHLTGRAAPGYAPLTEDHTLTPAQLHPYLDVSRLRGDYPVCVPEAPTGAAARPLTGLFDDLLAAVDDEGETGDRQRHELRRLEAVIRRLVDEGRRDHLSALWDEAAAHLVDRAAAKRKDELRAHLAARRDDLPVDGPVLACVAETAVRLFHAAGRAVDAARIDRFRDELDLLTSRLADVLAVDESHRPEARDAGHLEAAIGPGGATDIDAAALAELLSDADVGAPLPETRRARLQSVLETLEALQPQLFPEDAAQLVCSEQAESDAGPLAHCATAVGQLQARLRSLVTFFRAVHIGRLEVENRYRADRHDDYFGRYGWADLTDEEKSFCPPLLIHLDSSQIDRADKDLLVDLLGSGLPVRVLVTVDRVCDADGTMPGQGCFSGWRSRLAMMGVALQRAFVQQTAASNLEDLLRGFDRGLRFDGPSLFCVYTGSAAHSPQLPAYLRAAVSLEGRAFPAFTFHPADGDDWAARFDVEANPSVDARWPETEITYETADATEAHTVLPFTFADFLACDRRLSQHFMMVPRAAWHPAMTPLGDYLRGDAPAEQRVPYITMMDGEGVLHRVVVTREVARSAHSAGDFWHSLQELGGVDNSHVRRALDHARDRMEAEKQAALDALTQQHAEELDRATGALAEDIISNIAAGLLDVPAAGPAPAAPRRQAPAPAPKVEDEAEAPAEPASDAAPAEAEDEDEALSFDEPYIETPRCTTCNECTNLNGQMFAYNEDKQAFIKDPDAGPYRHLVVAAEECPVRIIHPGKPRDPDEEGLEELLERAKPFL